MRGQITITRDGKVIRAEDLKHVLIAQREKDEWLRRPRWKEPGVVAPTVKGRVQPNPKRARALVEMFEAAMEKGARVRLHRVVVR